MQIQPHSQACKQGRWRRPPLPFLKIEKMSRLWNKVPDCACLWFKFSIQYVVLRLSRRKVSKMFPCGASFSCVFDEMFVEVFQFHNSRIYTHIETLLRHIQAYSAPCVTLAYSQPCHILNPDISRTAGVFKTMRNVDQTYLKLCHRHYSTIFRHIQNLVYIQNTCICRNLAYSESWNIQNSSIIASPRKFRTLSY